jgi:amino acid transporter
MFIFYIIPLSFILTQYTITGYDASAHLSEETHSAADSAAKGIWRSIFYSAIGGWILLLAFLFAVQNVGDVTEGGGGVALIFSQALSSNRAGTVLLIATVGQFFCSVACMTSCTRMMFAFSRDGAVPGARHWSKLNKAKVPFNGVILTAVIAVLITLPALVEVDINGAPVPVAFFAVVTIGVIGLYVAFAIPIYLRWRMGDAFKQGAWNLGNKWRWMAPIAVAEIVITSIVALLPGSPAAVPWNDTFEGKYVNYTPIVLGASLLALWIGWHLSAKHWFTGPKHTIDLPAGVTSADELELEHEGHSPEAGYLGHQDGGKSG